MEHNVFATYYQLSVEEKVNPILCINQEHSAPMVAFWNPIEERSEFRCFVGHCDYKIIPGLKMYEDMMKQVYYAE